MRQRLALVRQTGTVAVSCFPRVLLKQLYLRTKSWMPVTNPGSSSRWHFFVPDLNTVLCRIRSRHHAGAGRAADSRGSDGPVKDHTLAREPVQIRCWNGPAVIQRQEIATQLVAEDDEDITQVLMTAHGNGFHSIDQTGNCSSIRFRISRPSANRSMFSTMDACLFTAVPKVSPAT